MNRLFLLLLSSLPGLLGAQTFDPADIQEVPVYEVPAYVEYVRVEMAYASSQIQNPEVAARWRKRKVSRVELVFTKYPQDLDAWLTSYQRLFEARMASLRTLDSGLFERKGIEWGYVQQTDCPTEVAAKGLFHGFVVYFEPPDRRMEEVASILSQEDSLKDSTAYQVLDRHPDWDSMLVVMDWTGSMYKYGASVLLWHRLNLERNAVKHFVFFNDGDDRADDDKTAGKTGGVYRVETNDLDAVLRKMNEVMSRGNGGDNPENDVEALYKGIKYLKGYDQVILIADNRSHMRDLHLAQHLTRPVKVVLCGVGARHPVHPDYLTLAHRTGGSVHTIEEDIDNLKALNEGREITIQGRTYRLEEGRFRLLPPTDRM